MDGYRGPLEHLSDAEFSQLAKDVIAALDDPPPPSLGLPGTNGRYDRVGFEAIGIGVEYLKAWVNQSTRRMDNLCRDAGLMLKRARRTGYELATDTVLQQAAEQAAAHPSPQPSDAADDHVYFIKSASGGIKIGKANDVPKRLRALQTAHPVRLELLATCSGGRVREQWYHRRFARHRLHGEWFEPHRDILLEIDRLNARGAA